MINQPLILIGGGGHCKSVLEAAESAGYTILGVLDILNIEFFVEPKDTRSNYWLNAVILKNKDEQLRFLEYTNDRGVMTRPIWELMNRLPMFENFENDGLKNTIWFADRLVNNPSSVR